MVCPTGQTHVKGLVCDPAGTNMCMTGFTCTSVTRGDQTIGVCCGSETVTVSEEGNKIPNIMFYLYNNFVVCKKKFGRIAQANSSVKMVYRWSIDGLKMDDICPSVCLCISVNIFWFMQNLSNEKI